VDEHIKALLNSLGIDTWLNESRLGWLLNDTLIGVIGIVLSALILYYIGRLALDYGIRQAVRSTGKHRSWHRKDLQKREDTLVSLFRNIWRIFIIAYIAGAILSGVFNIDLSPLFASAGILGVALGFGAQSLVKDFLSGVFIIAENQYRVGDVVDIEGAGGTVERIGIRSTVLRDAEGSVHYLPNGMVQHVINKTMGYSVSRFSISLDPATDITKATDIINKVGNALFEEEAWKQKIINPPQFDFIGDISGVAIELYISGKTQPSDQWAVTAEMRRRLHTEFEAADIKLSTLVLPTTLGSRKK